MNKKFFSLLCLSFFICITSSLFADSEQNYGPNPSGQISLPWDKFQKLLNLDSQEVSLDVSEFTMIMRQTDTSEMPPFMVDNGKIILKRDDFKKLLQAMKPPKADSSLGDFLITSSQYKAKMEKDATVVTAVFDIEVLPRKGRKDFVLIPLIRYDVALQKFSLDNKQALITEKNGYHAVAVVEEGSHTATAVFSITSDINKGPQSLSFPVIKTPITLLSLEIPLPSIQPEIQQATYIKRRTLNNTTFIEAVLSPTDNIQAAWSRVIPEAEKGPPKIYTDLWQLITIEDDAIRVTAIASINVLQNTITGLSFQIPNNYQILEVSGAVVGDWKEKTVGKEKFLEVPLKAPRQGELSFTLRAERIISDENTIVDFNGFAVPNAVREKGFVAVEMKGSAEAKVQESKGLDRAAFEELPQQLTGLSQKPLIFAYKYLRHPYQMVLDIQKHKELPVVTTVIDNASGVTLFTEDGKIVHQLTYTVRNAWKQFMELSLPKEAQLWGTFVNGQPVKPSNNESGKLLIPLNRSQSSDEGLTSFNVELIFFEKAEKFGWFGWKKNSFSIPDLMMSRVLWSIYLPFDYTFVKFGGTMEKEKIARGIMPLLGLSKRNVDYNQISREVGISDGASNMEIQSDTRGTHKMKGEEKSNLDRVSSMLRAKKSLQSDFGKNMPVGEKEVAQQLSNEMNFSQRVDRMSQGGISGVESGIMPIRVQVPTTGQVYRFAKQIASNEPLTVTFTYIYDTLFTIIKIIILLLIAYAIYSYRRQLKKIWDPSLIWYKNNLAKFITPMNSVIISAALFLISWFFFGSIFTKLFLLIFIVALICYFLNYQKKKKEKKSDE